MADYYGQKVAPTDGQSDNDLPPDGAADAHDSDSASSGEEDEVTRRDRAVTKQRLRQLGEVATFFGETDAQRTVRLNKLELVKDQDVLATGSTNVMQLIDRRLKRLGVGAVERDEEDYAARRPQVDVFSAQRTKSLAIRDSKPSVSVAGGGTSSRATKTDAADVEVFPWEVNGSAADAEAAEEAEIADEQVKKVVVWLRDSLQKWEKWIIERGKDGNESMEYKAEKANFRQSKQYLRPLRRALRDQAVSPDVVTTIAFIVDYCQQSKYKEAKEAYMRLAIGNTAWPLGLEKFTFHDRKNRTDIGAGKVAHILNDETTRKYIQMLKRLVTFYEAYCPTNPSQAA